MIPNFPIHSLTEIRPNSGENIKMVNFNNAYIAAEQRRIRNKKLANAGKLLSLIAAVTAIITYGVVA